MSTLYLTFGIVDSGLLFGWDNDSHFLLLSDGVDALLPSHTVTTRQPVERMVKKEEIVVMALSVEFAVHHLDF